MAKGSFQDGIEAELGYLSRHLDRLEEGFQIEKEEALKEGLKGMRVFREKCRTHYQVQVERIMERILQLCFTARRADVLTAELDQQAKQLTQRSADALARYSGTPNRLVRAMKGAMKEEE